MCLGSGDLGKNKCVGDPNFASICKVWGSKMQEKEWHDTVWEVLQTFQESKKGISRITIKNLGRNAPSQTPPPRDP